MEQEQKTNGEQPQKPLGKIYTANSSLKFLKLPFNRPVGRSHVLALARSIREHGWFGVITCIYTNLYTKNFKLYVIDGQHRIDAAELVGSKFRYEIKEVSTHEEVITLMADLNNNSKGWFLEDYLQPWMSLGIKSYRELHEKRVATSIPLASLIRIYSGHSYSGMTGGTTTQKFKRGSFVFKNRELGDKIIEELLEVRKITLRIRDVFAIAFADFYTNTPRYNRAKMLEALRKNKATVKLMISTLDHKELFKKIYAADQKMSAVA